MRRALASAGLGCAAPSSRRVDRTILDAEVVGGAAQAHAQQMAVDLRSANQREATDYIRHEALLRNVKFLPVAKVKRSLTRVWI